MGYLQLAENYDYLQEDSDYLQEDGDYSQLADNSASQVMANYIFIPGGLLPNTPEDKYVRLDFFDNLPEAEFLAIMQKLLPYQKNTLSDSVVSNLLGMVPGVGGALKGGANIIGGLFKGRKARKEAKAKKKEEQTTKLKTTVDDLIAKAKEQKALNSELPTKRAIELPPFDISTTIAGQDFQVSTQPDQKAENFFKRYRTPLLIGGGILALGTIYLMTRKKRK
jgi:hypothetical protein